MPAFAQSLRLPVRCTQTGYAQLLILEMFYMFLWLKVSLSLSLDKIERFKTGLSGL